MVPGAKREYPFLSARLFFIPPRSAKRYIKLVFAQRLLQRVCFHDFSVAGGAMRERAHSLCQTVWVGVQIQIKFELGHTLVPKRDHLAKLPGCVDMQKAEGGFAG